MCLVVYAASSVPLPAVPWDVDLAAIRSCGFVERGLFRVLPSPL